MDSARQWQPSTLQNFVAADSATRPTIFFVHGNRADSSEAPGIGLQVYHQLAQNASSGPPVRFVIFSWPSDQVSGPLFDVRVKGTRAFFEGYLLALLVDRMDHHQPISLVGYSFGARVVASALQVIAGGELCGYRLPNAADPSRTPLHAVLLAAAMDDDWLAIGQRMGLALNVVDRMLIVINEWDRILEKYRFIDRYRPEALGYTGIVGPLGANATKVAQSCISCREHELSAYIYNTSILAQIRQYTFFDGAVISPLAKKPVALARS